MQIGFLGMFPDFHAYFTDYLNLMSGLDDLHFLYLEGFIWRWFHYMNYKLCNTLVVITIQS